MGKETQFELQCSFPLLTPTSRLFVKDLLFSKQKTNTTNQADRVEHHRSIDNWAVPQAVLVVYIFAFCKLGSVKSIGVLGI